MADDSRLSRIRFLKIPPKAASIFGMLEIDPEVPLPVEIPLGSPEIDLSALSLEMILAGMLKVLAFDKGSKHGPYYRSFVLKARPGITGELMSAGIQAAEGDNFEIAEEVFLAVEGLVPGDLRATLNRAILAEKRAESYDRIGNAPLSEKFWEEAFALYKLLLASDDAHPDTAFYAAFFFIKKRNFPRARECFASYLETGQDEERLTTAREALERLGEQSELEELLSAAYDDIVLGKEAEGIAKAEAFIAKLPGTWNAWFLKGWAKRRLDDYAGAREAFLKAVALGAEDADLFNELAICSIELGLLAEARKELERALAIDADNIKIISNLGVLALKAGKEEEARAFFLAALEIEPKDPVSARYLAELDPEA